MTSSKNIVNKRLTKRDPLSYLSNPLSQSPLVPPQRTDSPGAPAQHMIDRESITRLINRYRTDRVPSLKALTAVAPRDEVMSVGSNAFSSK